MKRLFADRPLTSSEKNRRHYEKHREAELERNRIYHQDNKDEIRVRHRNNRHRITQDKFDAMYAEQDGKCAVCFKPLTETPHIDHNHNCCSNNRSCDKCRRKLLCKHCNVLIGMAFESSTILTNAIQYIKEYNDQSASRTR